jgi:hypothetical protein
LYCRPLCGSLRTSCAQYKTSFVATYRISLLFVTYNCYKSEGRGFDSRWCHWNFSLTCTSGRSMALGLTQSLTEISSRNSSWG